MTPTVLDHLLGVSALLREDMERAFAGTSLSESRVHLLWLLHRSGPSTQQRLADEIGITPRSVSALVDGLAAAGYVERLPHPHDRRAVLVTLGGTASAMMHRMEADHRRFASELLEAVAPEDRPGFERGLASVLAHLHGLLQRESVRYTEVEAVGPRPGQADPA